MSDFTKSFHSLLSWCNNTYYFACKNLSSDNARTASASSVQFYLPLCLLHAIQTNLKDKDGGIPFLCHELTA